MLARAQSSIERLIADYTGKKQYGAGAYVYFSSPIKAERLTQIKSTPGLMSSLKALAVRRLALAFPSSPLLFRDSAETDASSWHFCPEYFFAQNTPRRS